MIKQRYDTSMAPATTLANLDSGPRWLRDELTQAVTMRHGMRRGLRYHMDGVSLVATSFEITVSLDCSDFAEGRVGRGLGRSREAAEGVDWAVVGFRRSAQSRVSPWS